MNSDRSAFLEDILNNEHFAIYLTDESGTVGLWNHLAAKTLGFTAQEILNLNEHITFHDLQQKVSCGGLRYHWRMRKDGSSFFVKETVIELKDTVVPSLRFLKILENLSDNLQAHEKCELMAARYRKKSFASAVNLDTSRVLYIDEPLTQAVGLNNKQVVGSKVQAYFAETSFAISQKMVTFIQKSNRILSPVSMQGMQGRIGTWFADVNFHTDARGETMVSSHSYLLDQFRKPQAQIDQLQ